jgi:hypothetical protein
MTRHAPLYVCTQLPMRVSGFGQSGEDPDFALN